MKHSMNTIIIKMQIVHYRSPKSTFLNLLKGSVIFFILFYYKIIWLYDNLEYLPYVLMENFYPCFE